MEYKENSQDKTIKGGSKQQFGKSSLISTLFFFWVSPLLTYGSQFCFSQKAIPPLSQNKKPQFQFKKLHQTFKSLDKSQKEGVNLVKSIIATFKNEFLIVLLVALMYASFQLYQPILLNQIMNYAKEQEKSVGKGLSLFFTFLFVNLVISLSYSHVDYSFGVFGFSLSNMLSMIIFNKTLKYPMLADKEYSVSDIINYAEVDADRMTNIGFQLTAVIFAPFQIAIGFLLLYYYVGISFLVGTGIMMLMMIQTYVFGKIFQVMSDKLLIAKDERMSMTQQMIKTIKFIKVTTQQERFFHRLNDKRKEELNLQKKIHLLKTLAVMSYFLSTPLLICLTFSLYTYLDNQISSSKAFTTIILFRILQYPIIQLSNVLLEITQLWASFKRIQRFLDTIQLNQSFVHGQSKKTQFAVIIENGTFLWGCEPSEEKILENQNDDTELNFNQVSEENILNKKGKKYSFIQGLKNINMKIKSETVTMVVGDIGSGKSSLLYAILNEMIPNPESNPKINIYGDLAFCSQKPWIISGTVKENILFFLPEDKEKLKKVIYYASLQEDLKILGKGMDTQIGQRGVNLSGGQKARISLARALYSDRDIYLLDDVLSAVDVHVGKFLMEETILGYLRNKTVIMPTHAVQFAQQADRIIVMKKGEIIKEGKFGELFETKEFQQVCKLEKQKTEEKVQKQINQTEIKNSDQQIEQWALSEDYEEGQIGWKVYKSFLSNSGGLKVAFIVIFLMICWTTFITLANFQIQKWCEAPQLDSNYHLGFYFLFSFLGIVFLITRVYLMVLCIIKLGDTVHVKMIKSLLFAGITEFYNRVPVGRILNRLTSDLRQIDEGIVEVLNQTILYTFLLLTNLFICVYTSTLATLIPIIIIAIVCYKLQKYYLKSLRQCVRLQSITNSFLVSGFAEAVYGAVTIRAFNLEEKFITKQLQKMDTYKRLSLSRQAMSSWFSLRLGMLAFVVTTVTIGFKIFFQNQNDSILGLLLIYAMNLNDDMIKTTFCFVDLEGKMVSVQRVFHFTNIQPQIGYENKNLESYQRKKKEIFSKGDIEIFNFSAKYRKDLPTILQNINISIKGGEKVGIIGRTGAGKSTLFNCFLGIIKQTKGKIQIDEKSISQLDLQDLRQNITMIDQQPTIIKGSFLDNLDPFSLHSRQKIDEITRECNLSEIIEKKGGLEANISEDVLSCGEKQLVCICRQLLKQNKIVLIDEATANIDENNEKIIEDLLKRKLKKSTILTIAHRLSTVKNSDKILILGEGKVIEWGNPEQLLHRQGGIYKKMYEKNDKSYLY